MRPAIVVSADRPFVCRRCSWEPGQRTADLIGVMLHDDSGESRIHRRCVVDAHSITLRNMVSATALYRHSLRLDSRQSPHCITLHDSNSLDLGGGGNQLEDLLYIDLHAVVGEASVAEDDSQGFAGGELLPVDVVDDFHFGLTLPLPSKRNLQMK